MIDEKFKPFAFPGDAALSVEAQELLNTPNGYSADAHEATLRSAQVWDLAVSDATSERWRRILSWCQPMDKLLEHRDLPELREEIYQDIAVAVAPELWQPDPQKQSLAKPAYLWAEIVRSSLEDGSIGPERRRTMHDTVRMIGQVSVDKMYTSSLPMHIQTRRLEAIGLADLVTECMSDEELLQPHAADFRAWHRKTLRTNFMCNSVFGFSEDIQQGCVNLSPSFFAKVRLGLSACSEIIDCVRTDPVRSWGYFATVSDDPKHGKTLKFML